MSQYNRLGGLAIVALVVLRLIIGFHFFMEGTVKVKEGNFTSAGFLGGAVGPLAPLFQSMLPDHDGRLRSDIGLMKQKFEEYGQVAAQRYGFDAKQVRQKDQAVAHASRTLDQIAAVWSRDIHEYQQGFGRIEELSKDPTRDMSRWNPGVASLAEQRRSIETKWKGQIRPVLQQVDLTIEILEGAITKIANEDQRRSAGVIPFNLEAPAMVETSTVDKIIPIFDMVVGILLIIGLLTPLAGTLAGLFLLSVVMTQFPGSFGAQPTYYQAIEAVACFFLAFADAGRYAGLDFIPWSFWRRRSARAARLAVVQPTARPAT